MAILNLTTGIVYVRGWTGTLSGGSINSGDGTAAAPAWAFAAQPALGIWRAATGVLAFTDGSSGSGGSWTASSGFVVSNTRAFQWTSSGDGATGSIDTQLTRSAAGVVNVTTGFQAPQFLATGGANGQVATLQSLTELTTIAAAASTDTAIQMPAGAVVLGVSVRVTTVIPTATSFTVGDSGLATRFNNASVGVAANSTDPGTKAGAYYNASALAIRLTMVGGTPAANTGRVRVTIFYYVVTPPTS